MKNFKKGFSLVELLVVLSIATIMTAVGMTAMNAGDKDRKYVEAEGMKIESLIFARRNGALDGVGSGGGCNFGISVDGDTYQAVGCGPVSYKLASGVVFKEKKDFYFTSPGAKLFDSTSGAPAAVDPAIGMVITLKKNAEEYQIKIN